MLNKGAVIIQTGSKAVRLDGTASEGSVATGWKTSKEGGWGARRCGAQDDKEEPVEEAEMEWSVGWEDTGARAVPGAGEERVSLHL